MVVQSEFAKGDRKVACLAELWVEQSMGLARARDWALSKALSWVSAWVELWGWSAELMAFAMEFEWEQETALVMVLHLG